DDRRGRRPSQIHSMTGSTAIRAKGAAENGAIHRDFLQIPDFSKEEIVALFELAERMRAGKYDKKPLAGKSLAMIFTKASTRTRGSAERIDLASNSASHVPKGTSPRTSSWSAQKNPRRSSSRAIPMKRRGARTSSARTYGPRWVRKVNRNSASAPSAGSP